MQPAGGASIAKAANDIGDACDGKGEGKSLFQNLRVFEDSVSALVGTCIIPL
jgi:hypothetical protein